MVTAFSLYWNFLFYLALSGLSGCLWHECQSGAGEFEGMASNLLFALLFYASDCLPRCSLFWLFVYLDMFWCFSEIMELMQYFVWPFSTISIWIIFALGCSKPLVFKSNCMQVNSPQRLGTTLPSSPLRGVPRWLGSVVEVLRPWPVMCNRLKGLPKEERTSFLG